MNRQHAKKHTGRRVLAVLLSLLMLLQSVSALAGSVDVPETNPTETASVPAETGDTSETPLAETSTEDEKASEDGKETDPAPVVIDDIPAAGSDGPAEPAEIPDDSADTPDGNGGNPAENDGPEDDKQTPAEDSGIPEETDAIPATTPVIDTSESITMLMAGFDPTPVWFEGTLIHEGPDYTVTAVIGQDAMFPLDVSMRVEEILPGTELYEYYIQMMEETMEEDEEMGEFARFFDIAFIAEADGEETELEPQADIDVQITFREAIAVTEETDVQAVHIADDVPQILDASTDSLEAAVYDDEAIDTISFSSDSFSVYGVYQKVKKILKVITASGETFTIDVKYSSDARIPDDAELIAREITRNDPEYEMYRTQAALALEADDVRMPGLFEIGIYVDGKKFEPEAPVNVAILLNNGIEDGKTLYIVHFPDNMQNAIRKDDTASKNAEPVRLTKGSPNTEIQKNKLETQETSVLTEVCEASVDGMVVSFEANGFSVYALAYTVDFHYGTDGEEGQEEHVFSMPGGGSILLSDLLEILHVAEHNDYPNTSALLNAIDNVQFSDESLVRVEKEEDGKDWLLESLMPFTSEEELLISLEDGCVIRIPVTDAQSIVGSGTGRIQVSKTMEYPDGVHRLTHGTIVFALVKDGEYVYNQWGNLYVQEMRIQGNGLWPETVIFEGLPDGEYEVWEMHGDQNSGYGRAYDGMLMGDGQAQIDKIRVIWNSNGQQSANGLYNNNATIENGSTASMTFRNTFKEPTDTTSFEVNKVWMDRRENVIPAPDNASVVLTLYQQVRGQISSTGRTITLDGTADNDGEINSWQAVFTDLPKRDGNGRQITYMVRETTGWPDFYAWKDKGKNLMGEEYLRVSGGTIYNRKVLTTIAIQKHFDIQPNKYSQADWQEMLDKKQLLLELKREDTGEIWYYTLGVDNFVQNNTLFELRIPNMSYGTYTLTEYRYRGLITERRWVSGTTTVTRETMPGTNLDDPLNELRVQNLYREGQDEPEGAYIYALKVWDDLDNQDGIRPASVQVTLLANGEAYTADGVENPITLSETNDWNTGSNWYNLPIVDNEGHPVDYTVQEIDVPDGYTSTMTVSGAGAGKAYTITNRHRPEGIGTITLQKNVTAPAQANTPEKYYFTVKDSEGMYWSSTGTSGPDYYTAVPIEIDAETPITLTVPAGQYTVSEIREGIAVPGYTVTVTGEGNYSVTANENTTATITNIYTEQEQPGAVSVLKNWNGSFSESEKTATVKLMRVGTVGGDPATIRITGKSDWSNTNVYKPITQYPDGTPIQVGDRVRVSATFTWHQEEAIQAALSSGEGFTGSNSSAITFTYDANDQRQLWTYHYTFVVPDAITNLEMGHYQNENWTVTCLESSGNSQSGEIEPEEVEQVVLNSGNNWYYRWTGLASGYTYFVEEVDPAEHVVVTYTYNGEEVPEEGISQGTIVVTNTKNTGSISVTKHVKVNNEDSDELNGQTITIGLFQGESEPADDAEPIQTANLEITGADTTEVLFEDLGFGTYYIYELNTENHPVKHNGAITIYGNEYSVSEDGPSVVLDEAGETENVEITNSREYGSVKVKKTFSGITASEIPENYAIEATWGTESRNLTTAGDQDANVVLSGAFPEFTWTIDQLDIGTTVSFAESGYSIDGYILTVNGTEITGTSTPGSVSATAVMENPTLENGGMTSIVNAYEAIVDIEATKVWMNGATDVSTTILNASATIKLQESTDGENWTDITPGNAGETNLQTVSTTDTARDEWLFRWTGLPKYRDVDGTQVFIQYRVIETDATVNGSDNVLSSPAPAVIAAASDDDYIPVQGNNPKASAEIVNLLPTVDIEVNKHWQIGQSNTWPEDIDQVVVKLQQSINGGEASDSAPAKTAIITAENSILTAEAVAEMAEGEEKTAAQESLNARYIRNLPKYDDSGSLITYSVVEITPDNGFEVSYSPAATTEGGKITVTNTKFLTDILVVKRKGEETGEVMTGAEFRLDRGTTEEGRTTYESLIDAAAVSAEGENRGTRLFAGLEDGVYQIVETKAPAGYMPLGSTIEFTIEHGVVSYTGNSTLVIYTPVSENAPTTFTVVNKPGTALPSTGGSGTAAYTATGLALMILAGILLAERKRKAHK